ncbi:MAG: phosphate signaling complex protein PhoU [Chloroflexi bacterium]|nr:phosphate signaling complex protein PhoU [Chloroflexota bacterium]
MAASTYRSLFDRDLAMIRDDILRLGSLVDEQLQMSVNALRDGNLDLARQVTSADERINQLRYKIEDECLTTIATQQPAAGDLRRIITAMHMSVELERMADHASGIASIVIRMGDEPPLKPLIDIPRMQAITSEMLQSALDAFVRMDINLARATVVRDDEVDALYNQVLRELLTYMAQNKKTIARAMYLLWVAHNLERTADRVTNLCERVIFAVTGELGDYKPPKQVAPPSQ